MGIVKVKQAPCPSPLEWALIVPLLLSIMLWQIIRPIPIPSLFIYTVRLSYPNYLKSLGMFSGLIPFPLSDTCTLISLLSLS